MTGLSFSVPGNFASLHALRNLLYLSELELPAEHADVSQELKTAIFAFGGQTLRKKVKIGFLAPSAFVEDIECWATL
jgi:hypothetical protein